MREILFRGKRTINGDWVYGDFVRGNERKSLRDSIFVYDSETQSFNDYEINPPTLGQYTGLNDKNGKRIWEGDILHIAKIADGLGGYYHPPLDCPVNVVVKWDLCAWMWETLCENKRYISFPDALCHYECEIIGNIHDKKLEDFENGC